MKWYAGIGSRRTPPEVLRIMSELANALHRSGYVLRSGGADGADKAFERGDPNAVVLRPKHATQEAMAEASKHHPRWDLCKPYVRQLHGRNAQIILGHNLEEPADFVVCWTDAPPQRGGTQLGLSIARAYGIPVYNLILHDAADWSDRVIDGTLVDGATVPK